MGIVRWTLKKNVCGGRGSRQPRRNLQLAEQTVQKASPQKKTRDQAIYFGIVWESSVLNLKRNWKEILYTFLKASTADWWKGIIECKLFRNIGDQKHINEGKIGPCHREANWAKELAEYCESSSTGGNLLLQGIFIE